MNARIIIAMLALLGFGSACSGVKQASKGSEAAPEAVPDSVTVYRPIRLMYGVPVRDFQAKPLADTVRNASGQVRPDDAPAE